MRTLYWDTFAGISGDMALGSLIALGADPNKIIEQLHTMGLHEFVLNVQTRQVQGIHATDIDVIIQTPEAQNKTHTPSLNHLTQRHSHHDHKNIHTHQHGYTNDQKPEEYCHESNAGQTTIDNEHQQGHAYDLEHNHTFDQAVAHPNPDHDHHPRRLPDIQKMILSGALSERAKNNALNVFQVLAEAEAYVHGTTIDQVHFHEVGAVDSLVDIVGTCIALDLLDIDTIMVPTLPWSHGFVNCAHGRLPLPAPATLMLLRGFKFHESGITGELITPTGAALIRALAQQSEFPEMMLVNVGYGSGKNDYGILSLLRGVLGVREG